MISDGCQRFVNGANLPVQTLAGSGFRRHESQAVRGVTTRLVLCSRKRYSLNVKSGRSLRTLFALLVACVWIATACWAEHAAAEFPLCQPAQSPCCPQPVNNSSESCPACHVTNAVAAKRNVEQEREQEGSKSVSQTPSALRHQGSARVIVSRRELTRGLYYRPAVFGLKDDFRI